jgi:hypothetical protein
MPMRAFSGATVLVVAAQALAAAGLSGGASAAELRAAAAKSDITPSESRELWGYSDRSGPSRGIRDPLMAKVLLLDDGRNRLALVTLDLGRTFGAASMDRVRQRVRHSAQVSQVFFFASHTHSGPVIEDRDPEDKPPAWEVRALDRIGEAIERAAARLQPARLGVGEGSTFIGHNRRLIQPDGSVKMLWRNAARVATHPLDPRVALLRVDDRDGKVIAVLVNYACHPVVFGPDNLMYSADYPSAMAEVVEGAFGKDSVCLFLQGAAGDINPFYDKMRIEEDAVALMKETGRKLGEEALRVARSIATRVPEKPDLQFALDQRTFKPRYEPGDLLKALKSQVKPEVLARYQAYLSTPLNCPVTTILIDREIAIAGLPGEPFVEFGLDFRDRAPVRHAFFAGYANGYFGYFPTVRAAAAGGYGAEGIVARSEVGAGEAMVDMAIIRLYTMLGRLKPVPAR